MLELFSIYIFIFTTFASLFILYVAIYKSKIEKNAYFVYLLVHLAIYSAGMIIELTAKSPTQLRTGVVVEYMGFPFITSFVFLFVRQHINKPIKNKWVIAGLFFIPVLSFILVYTNNLIVFYFNNFTLITDSRINFNEFQYTKFYILLYTYLYFMILLSCVCVSRHFWKGNKFIRKKIIFLKVALLLDLLLGLLSLVYFTANSINFVPLFTMSACIYVKILHFSIPDTRGNVLEKMRDGYILVDEENNYLDANKIALNIFPELKEAKLESNLFNYIQSSQLNVLKNKEVKQTEFSLIDKSGNIKNYLVNVSTVTSKKMSAIHSWLIYDITDSKKMLADLECLANFDALTGVCNRDYFFSEIKKIFNGNKDKKKSFAIIMIDIDFFKEINDKYGHACGDKTLKDVASTLNKNIRKNDLVARYGGEEFVVYIDNTSYNNALNIGEKLRNAVKEKSFTYQGESYEVTISIGISLFDYKKHVNVSDVLKEADKRLYIAKNSGRNCVVIT